MGYEKGHLKGVAIAGTAVAGFLDGNLDIEQDTVVQIGTTDSWEGVEETIRRSRGSFRCLHDESDAKQDDLRAAVVTGGASATIASVTFESSTGVVTTGAWSCSIVVTKIGYSNPGVGGNIEMTVDFQVDGAVTEVAKADA